MTAKTDLTAQIAAYNRVLADATVECPRCRNTGGYEPVPRPGDMDFGPCFDCQGTGRIARFLGFRQECRKQWVRADDGNWVGMAEAAWQSLTGYEWSKTHPAAHCTCNGLGWQVRVGGLEDGLAGLTPDEFCTVTYQIYRRSIDILQDIDAPMPSAPEILAEGLRLVIEVAGL